MTGKKRYVSRTVVGGKRLASSELAKFVAVEPTGETSKRRAQTTLSDLIDQHIERHLGSPTTTDEYRAVPLSTDAECLRRYLLGYIQSRYETVRKGCTPDGESNVVRNADDD